MPSHLTSASSLALRTLTAASILAAWVITASVTAVAATPSPTPDGASSSPSAVAASPTPSSSGATQETTSQETSDASGGTQKLLLMLDVSGSMKEPDASGISKMKASQIALTSVVKTLPETTNVGLRVYGATVRGGKPTRAACADTQLAHPLTPLDKDGLIKQINSYKPKGETPIAYSLSKALEDLGTDGERNLILLSDGKESCVGDPCPAIRELIGAGINLRLDTVGVSVDAEARKQLQCLAEAGHGEFYDAKDTDQLIGALKRLAPPPAAVSNTIMGTPLAKDSPVIQAGKYLDTSTASATTGTEKWYHVQRRLPGSALHVSAAATIDTASDPATAAQRSPWSYELLTEDGTSCASMTDAETDSTGMGVLAVGSLVAQPLDPLSTATAESAEAKCAAASDFLFRIARGTGSGGDQPVEISVLEEPRALDANTLPPGVREVPVDTAHTYTPQPVPNPQLTEAGSSFGQATLISPGNYVTSVRPGQIAFFKTPVDWGQQATFAVVGPQQQFVNEKTPSGSLIYVSGNVYAPDRGRIDSEQQSSYAIYHDGQLRGPAEYNVVPEVRYRNRWDSPAMYFNTSRGFSMAGDYYLAVSVGTDSVDGALNNVPVPIEFSVDVTGATSGAPQYAQPLVATEAQQEPAIALTKALQAPASTPPPVAAAAPENTSWSANQRALGLGLGISALLIAGGTYALTRRRRTQARHVNG